MTAIENDQQQLENDQKTGFREAKLLKELWHLLSQFLLLSKPLQSSFCNHMLVRVLVSMLPNTVTALAFLPLCNLQPRYPGSRSGNGLSLAFCHGTFLVSPSPFCHCVSDVCSLLPPVCSQLLESPSTLNESSSPFFAFSLNTVSLNVSPPDFNFYL